MTGAEFDYGFKIKGNKPWAPSLDRVDSDLGYVAGNVRLVTVVENLALNEFGEEVFWQMMKQGVVSAKFAKQVEMETPEITDPDFLTRVSNLLPRVHDHSVVRWIASKLYGSLDQQPADL